MMVHFFAETDILPPHVLHDVSQYKCYLSQSEEGRALPDEKYELTAEVIAFVKNEIKLVEDIANQFENFRNLEDVNIVALSMGGNQIRGENSSQSTITLVVNNHFKEYGSVVAHELYHLVRSRVHKHPKTVGERVVEEGLANCFMHRDIQLTPLPALYRYEPYVFGYFEKNILPYIPKVKGMIESTNINVGEFFFGGKNFPPDFGYNLGSIMVDAWLMHNNKRAADVIHVPAKEIYQRWFDNEIPIIERKRLRTRPARANTLPKAEP
ncbi:MAG: hypothetical protein EOM37_01635 [Proteobacteria bacterium]|nr:hypothetical protein [Pseudomonadota bacterium]